VTKTLVVAELLIMSEYPYSKSVLWEFSEIVVFKEVVALQESRSVEVALLRLICTVKVTVRTS
jgi:hypothetical protein